MRASACWLTLRTGQSSLEVFFFAYCFESFFGPLNHSLCKMSCHLWYRRWCYNFFWASYYFAWFFNVNSQQAAPDFLAGYMLAMLAFGKLLFCKFGFCFSVARHCIKHNHILILFRFWRGHKARCMDNSYNSCLHQ